MKRLFVPAKSDIEFSKLSEESLKKLKKHKKIGLITTIQHLHDLDKIKTFFEKQGIQILIGGQVLGCNVENAKKIENEVDVFVYVGSGAFHPLAVAYNTNKPVFVVDYVLNNVLQVSEEARAHYLQKKIIRQEIAKQSNTFGILVSTKPGQENFAAALELKNRLEKQGKMAYLFLGDSISPYEEPNFVAPIIGTGKYDIECWINTACPRIVEDAWERNIVNLDDLNFI